MNSSPLNQAEANAAFAPKVKMPKPQRVKSQSDRLLTALTRLPKGTLKSTAQYVRSVLRQVVPIVAGLSLVGGLFAYSVLWPSLSLTNIQINNQSISSTMFLLTNDGWFPVCNVKISCNFIVTEYQRIYNGPKMESFSTVSFHAHVNTLKPSEHLPDSCQFGILESTLKINGVSGVSLTYKEILTYATKVHLFISIDFDPFFRWPLNKSFPFRMDLGRGLTYWIPEPSEHYEAAMKEFLHPISK